MRLSTSVGYLLNMPIPSFMEMVEEIIETDKEQERRMQERRQNG